MKHLILNMGYLSIAFLALFGLAEVLFHKTKLKVEKTRKLVHFGTGLLTMLFPIYLENHWQVLFLCSSFLVLLFLSQKLNLLQSINKVDRKTYGSLLFPVTVYISFLIANHFDDFLFFYLPILILSISDPLAALVGKKYPIGKYVILGHEKTLMGSSAFFISAFLIAFGALLTSSSFFCYSNFSMAMLIAGIACVSEGLCKNGYDNLTIPVAIMFTLHAFKIIHLC